MKNLLNTIIAVAKGLTILVMVCCLVWLFLAFNA